VEKREIYVEHVFRGLSKNFIMNKFTDQSSKSNLLKECAWSERGTPVSKEIFFISQYTVKNHHLFFMFGLPIEKCFNNTKISLFYIFKLYIFFRILIPSFIKYKTKENTFQHIEMKYPSNEKYTGWWEIAGFS
jgi:hypothetical protein